MKFEHYHFAEEVRAGISRLGYKKPTDIQFKAIPPILRGEDVLAIAQTGTGKTAAFAIPVVHILHMLKMKARADGVKCLIMVPTHELARQTEAVLSILGKSTRVSALCIHGGVDQEPQIKQLSKGVDVVIATPGRMFDLVSQGELILKRVEILVLDEADHMLDMGFIDDIRDLMRHLPKKRQTLFFSATINEKIKKLAYSLVTNAIRIQISPKNPVAKNIEHAVAFIEADDKRFFLEYLIRDHADEKFLIFVRTKVRAERVKKALERVEIKADTIHSDKLQEEREQTMNDFRGGASKVMIATDISARGIDIPNVDYVINYDLPEVPEVYVHRVGRTGRGNQKGQAISFCSMEEKALLEQIETNLGKTVEQLVISKKDYQYTVDVSKEKQHDWQSLLKEAQQGDKHGKRKNKSGR